MVSSRPSGWVWGWGGQQMMHSLPAVPLPFGRCSRVSKWVSFPNSPGAFETTSPAGASLQVGPPVTPPYYRSVPRGWGSHGIMAQSPISVWSLACCLCRSCSVSSVIQGDCSVYWYKFDVFVGRGEFRVSLCCYLGPILNPLWDLIHFKRNLKNVN